MVLLYTLILLNITLLWVDQVEINLYVCDYYIIATLLHITANNIGLRSYSVCHVKLRRFMNGVYINSSG